MQPPTDLQVQIVRMVTRFTGTIVIANDRLSGTRKVRGGQKLRWPALVIFNELCRALQSCARLYVGSWRRRAWSNVVLTLERAN